MSDENVELVRRTILAWNDRGVEALIEFLDRALEFHAPKESMNPGIYRGPDEVRDYFGRLSDVLQDQRVESVDMIDVNDSRVIAVVRGFAKTPHFEAEVEMNWAWLITVDNGVATPRGDVHRQTAGARSRRATGVAGGYRFGRSEAADWHGGATAPLRD
jgi:ketosteroid isomerase-like protein